MKWVVYISDLRDMLVETNGLSSTEDIVAFKNTIESIMERRQVDDIPLLCVGFNDDSDDHGVMSDLLSAVEWYASFVDNKVWLFNVLCCMPDLTSRAPEWADTIQKRILNDASLHSDYRHVLQQLDAWTRKSVIAMLIDIKKHNHNKYSDIVDNIIN